MRRNVTARGRSQVTPSSGDVMTQKGASDSHLDCNEAVSSPGPRASGCQLLYWRVANWCVARCPDDAAPNRLTFTCEVYAVPTAHGPGLGSVGITTNNNNSKEGVTIPAILFSP